MNIKTASTFKQLLQAETLNADENSYYQQYDVKILIAFHNKAMIKQNFLQEHTCKEKWDGL